MVFRATLRRVKPSLSVLEEVGSPCTTIEQIVMWQVKTATPDFPGRSNLRNVFYSVPVRWDKESRRPGAMAQETPSVGPLAP